MRYCLVLVLLLGGCAHNEIRVEKLPPPPVIEIPARPDLTRQPPAEQVRGLYDYILQLETRLREAVNALEAYRPAQSPEVRR